MQRRDFLKTIPLFAIPTLLQSNGLNAMPNGLLHSLMANTTTDHVLVVIQLNGGNDGLNTVIPLDQYSNLSAARSNILIPANQVLPLNGTTATGLHPAMTGMQTMYNDGKLLIVQGVSYPNPDFSHFRATDIWLTASDSNQYLTSGWAARYLETEYPNYPTGYPNANNPDPLAIQIGSGLSPMFIGNTSMGMAFLDATTIYNMANGIVDPAPSSKAGKELTYIRGVMQQTESYYSVISQAHNAVGSQFGGYPATSLADSLKEIARLIAGGLQTRMYMVSLGGFDTHDDQVDSTDLTQGEHATLLQTLSDAVYAFQQDLQFLGIADRVVGMTFSEFGRRIKSNASLGTDHGAAEPLFIFGNKVQSGILGTNPVIPATVSTSDNLPMQYDFRSVYASLLKDWFCVDAAAVPTIMLQNFQTLPLVQSSCNNLSIKDVTTEKILLSNYPNPFTTSTYLTFETTGGHTSIQIFNCEGRMIANITDGNYVAGKYEVWWNADGLAAGNYYARLQNGALQQVRALVKVRE